MLLIHIFFIGMYCHHIRQEHIMGSQRQDLSHLTFNVHRTLFYHRCFHLRCRNGSQSHFFEFIHVPSAFHATVICGKCQLLRGQIDHEFSGLLQDRIGISLGAYGDRHHGRIGTYGSYPGQRDNIGAAVPVSQAHHNNRQGIQHISRLPKLFSHFRKTSFPLLSYQFQHS